MSILVPIVARLHFSPSKEGIGVMSNPGKNKRAMKFKTQSGSLYEINTDSKQIRILSGNPSRITNNWKKYADVHPPIPTIGQALCVFWDPKDTPLLEGSNSGDAPITITSVIKEIVNEL
jgi:hypothetical protein